MSDMREATPSAEATAAQASRAEVLRVEGLFVESIRGAGLRR